MQNRTIADVSQLWSQLQLRADLNIPSGDLKANTQNLAIFELEIRQNAANDHKSEQPYQRFDYPYDIVNLQAPLRVPLFVLCAVSVSLRFSCNSTAHVPRKRPCSENEIFLDLFDRPVFSREGMLKPVEFDQQFIGGEERQLPVSQSLEHASPMHNLDDSSVAVSSVSDYVSSKELFADLFSSPTANNEEETKSIVFSSQGSTFLQSQGSPPETASEPLSSLTISSMKALLDGAFRSLICPKPIRTAPGIRIETSKLEARLTDIAPSTFTPGYMEAVAARAPLVPTIARFLTSFLQKSRSSSVTTNKDQLIEQYSEIQCTENLDGMDHNRVGETKLKEVVKMHLWMAMTNGLRNAEPACRLKPLRPFAKLHTVRSDSWLGMEGTAPESSNSGESSEQEMLQERYSTCPKLICGEADNDNEMLEFDKEDGLEDYGYDLFEEVEQRLRYRSDHDYTTGLTPVPDDMEYFVERHTSPTDSPSNLLPPMLELQGQPCEPSPAEQRADMPAAQITGVGSATAPPAPPRSGSDDTWINLLDEGSPCTWKDATANKSIATPHASIHNDPEPDFEQWEFDAEQGSDEMLF